MIIKEINEEKYPFGISICVSAYDAQDYIEECLDSIYAQTWFVSNNNWEVIIGVDGCKKSLEKIKSISYKYKNLKVFMMNENVGTYITCNNIFKEAKYSWILRFDSDDVMYKNMVEKFLYHSKEKNVDYVTTYCDNGIKKMNWGEGQMMIKKDIFIKYGGFLSYRCGCDTELRVRTSNKIKQYSIKETLFYRRPHENSLTTDKKTGYKSDYRNKIIEYINTKSKNTPIIEYKTSDYYLVNLDNIIVSFTTWKKRHDVAAKMLENFKKQTLKPDKIYCWLSSDEYGGENIPKCLQKFVDENYIEVKWIKENTYCHKRYEVFKEHFNDYVFLIDDDIYYEKNYLETLYNSVKKINSITCLCGYHFEYENDVNWLELDENPSFKNQYLSGLSCFPPKSFPMNSFDNIDLRNKVSKKCDDSWIHAHLIKNNIPIYLIFDRKKKSFKTIENSQGCSIWKTENSIRTNGILNKTITFKNVLKSLGLIERAKEIWPNIVFDMEKKETIKPKEELKIEQPKKEPQLQIEQPKIEESQPQKVIIGKKITPKPKETLDQKYKKIIRIKEDIKNGRIQRVLDKDGKLVWKRVR